MLEIALSACLVAQFIPPGFRNSLAPLEGEFEAAVRAPTEITRDSLGIPTIAATSVGDLFFAQGFAHGQDRFFAMDLQRRYAAGELAALIGPMMAPQDMQARKLRFRAVAREVVERLPDYQRELLERYAAGVNAGLASLRAAPPEYLGVNAAPVHWLAEDSMLVVFSMARGLNWGGAYEPEREVLQEALPPALFDFLVCENTRFDAPLFGEEEAIALPAFPGPDVVDLRGTKPISWRLAPFEGPDGAGMPGSNNWAVSGARTKDGRAIAANDPHLPIAPPGFWYRVHLRWPGGEMWGVSLPGMPGVMMGSFRAPRASFAWGCTNAMLDLQDMILVETDPNDADRYLTPEGSEPFGEVVEHVAVLGEESPRELRLRTTRWGVVSDADSRGRPLVLRWTVQDAGVNSMDMFDAFVHPERFEGLEEALAWVGRSWVVPQNIVVADGTGRIGYVLSGALPLRRGMDGRTPASWAVKGVGWEGYWPESQRPMLVDPPSGVLYTANNRVLDLERAARLGWDWDLGVRAGRIRDMLAAKEHWSEPELFRLMLDSRAPLGDFYRDLILEVTSTLSGLPDDKATLLVTARGLVQRWDGTANAEQVGYAVVRAFALDLRSAILSPLLDPARKKAPRYSYRWVYGEEAVRRILEARPEHLLPPPYESWTALLQDRLAAASAGLRSTGGMDLSWGDRNGANFEHPAVRAAPIFAELLNWPGGPQSGDGLGVVRAATPSFGASMRMVVSPGREADGLLTMPGGQSGHPLSAHYRDQHDRWFRGETAPFLPGPMSRTLFLLPRP